MAFPENSETRDAWLTAYLLGEASTEKQLAVEAWLRESKENQQHFDALEAAWLASGPLPQAPVNAEAAWEKVREKIQAPQPKEPEKTKVVRLRPAYWGIGIAATLALLIVGVLWWRDSQNTDWQEVKSLQATKNITLPDGSAVTLKPGASLRYLASFEGETMRKTELRGSAFFEVTKSKGQGFEVATTQGKVQVLGTKFLLESAENKPIRCTVTEGRVALIQEEKRLEIAAGEAAVFGEAAPEKIAPESLEADQFFWKDQSLNFRGQTLQKVVETLTRNYGTAIKIQDSAAQHCLVTAKFKGEEIEAVLQVIALSLQLEVEKQGNTFVLKGVCP